RLALRLPAQAGPLLDVEIGQQHVAAGTDERDRGRARERGLSHPALLGGKKNMTGHGLCSLAAARGVGILTGHAARAFPRRIATLSAFRLTDVKHFVMAVSQSGESKGPG